MAWKSNPHYICRVLKDPDNFSKLPRDVDVAMVFGKIGGVVVSPIKRCIIAKFMSVMFESMLRRGRL